MPKSTVLILGALFLSLASIGYLLFERYDHVNAINDLRGDLLFRNAQIEVQKIELQQAIDSRDNSLRQLHELQRALSLPSVKAPQADK